MEKELLVKFIQAYGAILGEKYFYEAIETGNFEKINEIVTPGTVPIPVSDNYTF